MEETSTDAPPRRWSRAVAGLLTVMALAYGISFAASALASSGGISGHTGDPAVSAGATCASCHTGGVVPAVSLTGPVTVAVGSQSRYTLTITGGQAAGGGFGVSATAGSLVSTAGDTRLLAGQIVQQSTKPADPSGAVSWTFDWTAPASPGSVTLYASGNSVNMDGGPGGDASAETSLAIVVNPVPNADPVAVIGGPYAGVVREGISFDGTGSRDPDGTITSYRWDFGDGSPVVDFGTAGARLQHSYAATGTYTVTLTVVDDTGASTGATTSVTVTSGTPPPPPTIPPTTTTTVAPTTTNPPTTTAPPPTTTAAASVDGRAIYAASCASCHGPSGQGGAGPSLVTSTSSRSVIRSIVTAGQGTMPGFGAVLSAEEIAAVAAVTASMQSSTAPAATTTTLAPAATGADIYASSCASCHGAGGEGGIGPSLIDAPLARAVVGSVTANGSGTMPAFGDRLTSSQIDLVSAYVESLAPADIDAETADPADGTEPSVIADPGATLYAANCASCHGANGTGGSAEPLDRFFERDDLIGLINRGPGDMPAFAELLSDADIELIADHVARFADAPEVDVEVAGRSEVAAPRGPAPQSRELIERLDRVPATTGTDDRPGFPTLLALGMALVTVVIAGAVIRRVGPSTTPLRNE